MTGMVGGMLRRREPRALDGGPLGTAGRRAAGRRAESDPRRDDGHREDRHREDRHYDDPRHEDPRHEDPRRDDRHPEDFLGDDRDAPRAAPYARGATVASAADDPDLISGPISRGWSAAGAHRRGRGAASAEEEPESAWSLWGRSVDHFTIGACLVLFSVGVVLAFATSPPLAARNGVEPFYYAWRQLAFGAPAFFLLIALSTLSPTGVRRIGVLIGVGGLIALAALPVYGQSFGKEAVRWFSVGGVSLQPSELAKPGLVIFAAWLLCAFAQTDARLARAGGAASALVLGAAVALLVIQPDYGQAALLLAAWSAMYFVAGGPIWVLTAIGALAGAVGAAAYAYEPHIAARIDSFLDPAGGGQTQLQRAAEAVVNGGWFGAGLGEGVASARLPDAHSDFIFAVAVEEFGLAFCLGLIGLFALTPLRALTRLRRVADPFAYIAGVGLSALFGLQALVHIAVTARLAPATGMTLPFVSYGGSSLIAMGVTVGLLIALTRRR